MKKVSKKFLALIALPGMWLSLVAFCAFGEEVKQNVEVVEELAPQVKLPARILLTDSCEVDSPRIYFEKIGSCEGNKKLCEEISGVDLGKSPPPGLSSTISMKEIKAVLEKELPASDIEINGPEKVKITSTSLELNSDMISVFLKDALDVLGETNSNTKLELLSVRMTRQIKVWPGDYEIHFPGIQGTELEKSGLMQKNYLVPSVVEVEYVPEKNSENKVSFNVFAQIAVRKLIPVLATNVERGTLLKKEFFETNWQIVNRTYQKFLSDPAQLEGLVSKRKLSAGYPISEDMVEVPVVIKRGQIVRMLWQNGDLNITGQVTAMSSGGVGETVQVLFAPTKKHFYAKILDDSTVEVIK